MKSYNDAIEMLKDFEGCNEGFYGMTIFVAELFGKDVEEVESDVKNA